MKKFLAILIVSVFAVVVSGSVAMAKDLTGKIGLGFNSQLDCGAISVKYGISNDMGVEGFIGYGSYEEDYGAAGSYEESSNVVGGKFFYNVIMEKNANFYIGGGLAILGGEGTEIDPSGAMYKVKFSGTGLLGYAGTEFFFTDLPNLGFLFEVGLGIMNGKEKYNGSSVDVSDMSFYGGLFHQIGIHYYF